VSHEHICLSCVWTASACDHHILPGSDVKFYALVAVNHQYRLVGLTPGLSCIAYASNGLDRKALSRAFVAASVVQARILRDAERFLITPPPEIPPTARRFPSITRLRKWHSSADDYLSFQILGFHPDRQPCRPLYVAETTGLEKETILIKFVQEYLIELHDFCAKRGHAPRIFAFETLPGGWRAIAMELIVSAVQITSSPVLDTHGPRWASELKQLVDEFHEEGLVHGDLRDANMISGGECTVMLIDFDWGGKDGQVFYPTPNLNDELLLGRTSNNLKITKDDNIRVLNLTLKKLSR
jgi:serine/threonine protein kinase